MSAIRVFRFKHNRPVLYDLVRCSAHNVGEGVPKALPSLHLRLLRMCGLDCIDGLEPQSVTALGFRNRRQLGIALRKQSLRRFKQMSGLALDQLKLDFANFATGLPSKGLAFVERHLDQTSPSLQPIADAIDNRLESR